MQIGKKQRGLNLFRQAILAHKDHPRMTKNANRINRIQMNYLNKTKRIFKLKR